MTRLRVGVVFGGRSGEHEVSVMSARGIVGALDRQRFEPVLLGIDRAGKWLKLTEKGLLAPPLAKASDVVGEGALADGREVDPMSLASGVEAVEVFFPIVHGSQGEDGCLQGLLEMLGVPYVGCGVLASAIAMDKDVTKRLLRDAGLGVVPWVALRAQQPDLEKRAAEAAEQLGWPCFVKPASLGSSVGISKARDLHALVAALRNAFRFDEKVLIERGVDAREIEMAVLGGPTPRVSEAGEVVPRHEFYSYEAKYLDDQGAELLVPAPLSEGQMGEAKQLALAVFQCLGLEGLARVDFFLDRISGSWFVNEANTLPGFTPISMYARMWEASGLAYPDLLTELIELARARFARRQQLSIFRD